MKVDGKVTIRRATRADRSTLLELHRALYVTHRDRIVPDDRLPLIAYRNFDAVLREDVESMLSNPDVVFLVAEIAGAIVGYVTGHVENDARRVLPKKGVIEDWYVSEATRGLGVGKTLLATAENIFRQVGCQVIESATWPTNDGARRAHEALGFQEIQIVYRKRIDEGRG